MWEPCEKSRFFVKTANRPRSIYQYSSIAPRLSSQNCKFFKLLLSLNSQKKLGYKENNTKYMYRILTRKPQSHVRILIYRTWPIGRPSRFFRGFEPRFRVHLHVILVLFCVATLVGFDVLVFLCFGFSLCIRPKRECRGHWNETFWLGENKLHRRKARAYETN